MYKDAGCKVRTENGLSDAFDINTGVRQGCILSPFLFILVIDWIMKETTKNIDDGIPWNDKKLCDLDFADDIAILADSAPALQRLTDELSNNAAKFGLRISSEKSKIMQTGPVHQPPTINCNGVPLECVEKFTYLGSVIANDGDSEKDVRTRMGMGYSTFRRLNPIWRDKQLTLKIKIRLYKSLVLTTALYGSETWKDTAAVRKLTDPFHTKCLRKILNISWKDRITNVEVYRRTEETPLSNKIFTKRTSFAGHVLRLPPERPARHSVLHWTPEGKRKRGRPRITWRSTLKKDLTAMGVDLTEAIATAEDRSLWTSLAALCLQDGRI